MSNDILYPILIGVACLVIVIVVHRVTRPRPSRSDITLPDSPPALLTDETSPSVPDLEAWHRTHESALLGFIEYYDGAESHDDESEVSTLFDQARSSHPAPEMQAELAALRAAADAMTSANERNDGEANSRHSDTYETYRDAWLDRLWQFPVDRDRVESVRKRTGLSDEPDETEDLDDLDTGDNADEPEEPEEPEIKPKRAR